MKDESTMSQPDDETTPYQAVMNLEEQYSIWPAARPLPLGWRPAGKTGTRSECLAFIEETWTDMRPLSVRRQLVEEKTGLDR